MILDKFNEILIKLKIFIRKNCRKRLLKNNNTLLGKKFSR